MKTNARCLNQIDEQRKFTQGNQKSDINLLKHMVYKILHERMICEASLGTIFFIFIYLF